MALIRVTCNDCGDVESRSRDIRIRTCEDTDESTYLFRCPVCRMIEVRYADPHVVDVLLAAGCDSERWRLPMELWERQTFDKLPVINHDDVLDFHTGLGDLFGSLVVSVSELDECRQDVVRQLGAES